MSFIHPGRLFLEKHGQVSAYEDVLAYAEFLRGQAGLNGKLPVDLQAIVRHFDLNPQTVPLPGQQGLLLDAERGLILINANDIEHRQKFTLAHEMIELLFHELPNVNDWGLNRPGGFQEGTKEFLCNWAGANLLMPPSHVQEVIENCGVSFDCANSLVSDCDVSFSAALIQLARKSSRRHVVVHWQMKNKPTEIKKAVPAQQMGMLPDINLLPPKKLRVEWSYGGINSPFIPKDKSTENTSLIYSAWETGKFTSGRERMTFNNQTSHWCTCENMPYDRSDNERCVLSLIELV